MDSDYGQIKHLDTLIVSQRPSITRSIENHKKSQYTRTNLKFKTIQQRPESRQVRSQLGAREDPAPCPNCFIIRTLNQSQANEIEDLQEIISQLQKCSNKLNTDLQKAKFLLKEQKVAKDNASIKKNQNTENLELRVKLLQDSLTQRNQQLQEQETQNQNLINMLEHYDAKLELAHEQLQQKDILFKLDEDLSKDMPKVQEMILFYCERLQSLKALKHKCLQNQNQDGDSMINRSRCQAVQQKLPDGHINYRQSQKSINQSNYSSEPLLSNVKFN